tara:strand:+ start:264 stop:509 length:246 start_codon:yes stop_codon:yes gene_type:complete
LEILHGIFRHNQRKIQQTSFAETGETMEIVHHLFFGEKAPQPLPSSHREQATPEKNLQCDEKTPQELHLTGVRLRCLFGLC